jgi:hypothetical protein
MKLSRTLVLPTFVLVAIVGSYLSHPTEPVLANQAEATQIGISKTVLSQKKPTVCYVFVEPLRPGQLSSQILETRCGQFTNDSRPEYTSDTRYLIASFYDNKDFGGLLVQYIGSEVCSSTTSYGFGQLPTSLDNRFSSGSGYSGCNYVYVYDLVNYGGDSVSCFANCGSFGSLNDRVSSWSVTN